jgi:hypothetical protein
VEFGPIVVRNNSGSPWNLDAYNASTSKRPRKFSTAAIAPRSTSGSQSDQKEYWSNASPGFAAVIDLAAYQTLAKASSCANPTCTNPADCVASPANSCYFPNVGSGDTAIFGGGFTNNSPLGVIYVKGNAEFDRVTVNMANSGAVIVDGRLTLGANSFPAGGYTVTTLPLPPTVALDDPYCTCCDNVCLGSVDRHIDIGGFLYVTKDLTTVINSNWTLNGAARVDGTLRLGQNSTMYLFYNDVVNHKVLTKNFELLIDSMTTLSQ